MIHTQWYTQWHTSTSTRFTEHTHRGVYAPRFLSHHNKDLEWWTLKPPWCVTALGSWTQHVIALRSQTDRVIALRQISVTALFYLEDRKIHLQGVRAHRSKHAKRRAPQRAGGRESPLAPLYVFFFPLGLFYAIGLSQECCSTWSPHSCLWTFLWLSSVLFSQAFPFLVFSVQFSCSVMSNSL